MRLAIVGQARTGLERVGQQVDTGPTVPLSEGSSSQPYLVLHAWQLDGLEERERGVLAGDDRDGQRWAIGRAGTDVPSQDQVGCPVAVDVRGPSVARREPEDGGRVDRQGTSRDPDVGDEGRSVAGRRDHLERAGAELDQPRRAAVERCRQVGRRLGLDGPGRLAPEEVDMDEPERRLVEGERQEVGRPTRAVDERDVDERTIENRRDGRVGGTCRSIDSRDQPRPEEHCGDHRPAPWAGRPGGHR